MVDELIGLAHSIDLYHTPDGTGRITYKMGEMVVDHPINSNAVRRWLKKLWYEETERIAPVSLIDDTVGLMECRALYERPCRETHIRVASGESAIYIDLCNGKGEAIKLQADGWAKTIDHPIKFVKHAGMSPLPEPQAGGSIDKLWEYVNIPDEKARKLFLAWLISAMWPGGPYPILLLSGEQGSAKSTATKIARMLIDPSESVTNAFPKTGYDLFISACKGHVASFDNASKISPELADDFCRLTHGGGYRTRRLYTAEDELIIRAVKPVVINGIDDLCERSDFLSRCIAIHLPYIPDRERKTETDFWSAFAEDYPQLLGALMNALSRVIRELPGVRVSEYPRMADFYKMGIALERALGWGEGAFVEAYEASTSEIKLSSLEGNYLAQATIKFMGSTTSWTGTSTDLLTTLSNRVSEDIKRSVKWPKAPNSLSASLRRSAPILRQHGVTIEIGHSGIHRAITLRNSAARPTAERATVTSVTGRTLPASVSVANPGQYAQ